MSRIRPATLADYAGIDGVHRRNAFGGLDPFFWEQICLHHPYRSQYPNSPPGWVIETDEGSIVGSLINILMPAEFEGRAVRGAASGTWGVDAEHRDLLALGLKREWFGQADAEMWLVGTANATATKIMGGFRAERIPMPHYLDGLFWILDSRRFMQAVARKRNIPAGELLAWPAGLALGCYAGLLKRRGGRGRLPVRVLDAFDSRFDDFWEKLRNDVPRLRVVRNRAMLAWRFASTQRRKGLTVLIAEKGGSMAGYAVLSAQPRAHLGLDQNIVADLQAVGDDPEVLDSLLGAAIAESKSQHKHALEFQGYHASKYQVALRRRPFRYHYETWPLFYRCREKALYERLRSEEYWDFCPLDAF